jgi:outer membrane receptor protein involved in Fe transport
MDINVLIYVDIYGTKIKQMTKTFILLTLIMLIQLSAWAQPAPAENETMARSGRIKGTIIDSETSQPMEYANIAIFNKRDSSLVTGGITNQNGQFDIGGLGYGEYYAEAIFIGYEKTSMPAIRILPTSQVIDLGRVTLSGSTMQLEAVNIVAERQRIEYRIDKKVINVSQDINAAGGTAVDVLENTPSVEVDIDGNVLLRGSSSFTVLIDGRPSVLSGSDALRQLPASAIENIEIITNPSAKYDPDGMAGIINVVMKKNILSGFNGIINAMIGTRDKYRSDMTLNYRTKKSNLFFGADWSEDNSYGNFFSERETYRNDTTRFIIADGRRDFGRSGFNVRGGADLYLSDLATLTISGTAGQNGSDRNGGSKLHEYTRPATTDKYMINDNISRREGTQFSTNISFQQKFNTQGTHKLDALLYISGRNSDDSETQDEYLSGQNFTGNLGFLNRIKTWEDDRSADYRFKIDYVKPLPKEGKLEAGLQSTITRDKEDFFFSNFDPVNEIWINNPLYTSTLDFSRDIHAGYFTWSAKSGRAQYMGGLRGEYTFRETDHEKAPEPFRLTRFDLFPSGHLSFEAGKSTQIMTSYSRRINRPSGRDLDPFPGYLNQYTIRIGNPELKPQYTSSYELGLMQRFGSNFLSVETFYRTTNNLISQVQELRDDGIFYLTSDNINRDFSLGSEVMGNFNLTKWFLLNSSISLFNYRIKGELNGQNIDRESTNYSARINGSFRLAADSRIQLTAFYRGPSVQAQGESKGMFFSNLSYRQEFLQRKLTATLSLRDILGTMRFENMSYGPDFRNKFRMERESRVVQLTLSYKINNYRQERNNGDGSGGDNGMRMDMDF